MQTSNGESHHQAGRYLHSSWPGLGGGERVRAWACQLAAVRAHFLQAGS